MSRLNVIDRLHEITLPTVAIGGTQDRTSPAAGMRVQLAGFPNFEFVEINSGTHMMALEQSEALAQALGFLRKVSA